MRGGEVGEGEGGGRREGGLRKGKQTRLQEMNWSLNQ